MTAHLTALFLAAWVGHADGVTTPAEFRSALVESRERLKSGIFEVESEYKLEGAPFKKNTYLIVIDSDKRRMDREGPAWLDNRDGSSVVKHCVNEDTVIKFTNMFRTENNKNLISSHIIQRKLYGEDRVSQAVPNFSVFGVLPGEFETYLSGRFGECWTRWLGEVESEKVVPIVVDGKARLEYSWSRNRQTTLVQGKLLVSPDEQFAVLRSEVRAQGGKQDVVQVVTNRVAVLGDLKVWVPVESHFTSTEDGRVRRDEKVVIKPRFVNESIDPRMFTLAGMGVPSGTRFMVAPSGKLFDWDGSRLVEFKRPRVSGEADMAAFEEHRRRGAWRTTGIIVGVLGCLGLIGLAFVRFRSQVGSGRRRDV